MKIVKEHIGFHYIIIYTLILLEFKIFLKNYKTKSRIYQLLREYLVIMCRFYCTAFIEYMLAGKTLLDYTNLLSPNGYKKNDNI